MERKGKRRQGNEVSRERVGLRRCAELVEREDRGKEWERGRERGVYIELVVVSA